MDADRFSRESRSVATSLGMTFMRIRVFSYTALLTAGNAAIAFAQEHAAEAGAGEHETYALTDIRMNLMVWTLVTFLIAFFVLKKYAFPPMFRAVEAREKALEDAIEGAKRDRQAASALLAEQQKQLEAARGEAQKYMSDARGASEKVRADLLEQTRKEQGEMLERARRDIEAERDKAIAQLRREAVEMAILGATKVIEENLDNDKNRKMVESYLSSIGTNKVTS
jgi:F-type H+-transporting ATPase subunit b